MIKKAGKRYLKQKKNEKKRKTEEKSNKGKKKETCDLCWHSQIIDEWISDIERSEMAD